jgi:hypothetical protein
MHRARKRQGGFGCEPADNSAFGARTKYGTHPKAAPHKLTKPMQKLCFVRVQTIRRRGGMGSDPAGGRSTGWPRGRFSAFICRSVFAISARLSER